MNNGVYNVLPLNDGKAISIWKYLFMVVVVFCSAISLVNAQPAGVVKQVAAERFVFNVDGSGEWMVPMEWNYDPNKQNKSIEHVVVMTTGYGRYNPYGRILSGMLKDIPNGEKVAYYMPQFLIEQDVLFHDLGQSYLYWSKSGWAIGDDALNGGKLSKHAISTFAVVDELLRRVQASFPNLKTVTVGGFSAGGQFTNRYLATNRVHEMLESKGLGVSYIVGAPSSYLYFCKNRLINREPIRFGSVSETAYAKCADFNSYRYGLDNLNTYMAGVDPAKLIANYAARKVAYITGADDDARASADLMTGCAAMLQGDHRRDRMEVYLHYLEFRFGKEVLNRHRLYVIPDAAHSISKVFNNPIGKKLLFGALLD